MTAAEDVVRRMTERGLRLAVAESTTGGLTGHLVVAVPGASKVFVGGVAAYGRKPKIDWLRVPEQTVAAYGSVHEETVLAMARGARDALEVDVAIAESGIASPTNNPDRPGGLYCLAIVGPAGYEHAERQVFEGDREATMRACADRLLAMILEYLDGTA
ncbi:MAG: CinA family protein [Dehalococcoidia bacterium]|nr:CinA family protein [Dehalococcoidia bacterium]MCB9483712.1 CinA family protein [Dehalococcoidia bacterium]